MQGLVVRFDDTFDSVDFWCVDVTVQSEAVTGSISHRKLCAKAVSWEHLIVVVVLDDFENRAESSNIVVLVGRIRHVMQGLLALNFTV